MDRLLAEYADKGLAIILVDHDWIVIDMTTFAAKLFGYEDKAPLIGRHGTEMRTNLNVVGPEMIKKSVVLSDDFACSRNPVHDYMRPVADQVGLCISWMWLVDVHTGKLTRCIVHLVKLEVGYGCMMLPLEDPTHRCFVEVSKNNGYLDEEGREYTEDEVDLLDAFMSGATYKAIGVLLGTTETVAKKRMYRLCDKIGAPTPAHLREEIWAKHGDEILIDNRTILPVHYNIYDVLKK